MSVCCSNHPIPQKNSRQFMKIKRFNFILLYIFILFLMTILPINGKNSTLNDTYFLQFRSDHIFHALFFFPWMILPNFFSSKKTVVSNKFPTISWFFGGLLLAISAESIQYFLPYRSFTLTDLLFNITGLLLGGLCLPILKAVFNLF